MLQINDLDVLVNEKKILENINLSINEGEIHVIMGPNGSGKSSLCKAIMNHPSYQKENGTILFNDNDITKESTDKIAQNGIYYIDQSPMEIEGVTNAELIRTALQSKNEPIDIFKFTKKSGEICEMLNMPKNFIHREVNVGMSGGEKKKNELLGLMFLNPLLIILDEIDSGLDVDAIKIVGETLKEYQKNTNCAILMVSHQPMLMEILKPTHSHLLFDKQIVKNSDYSLVEEILKDGFRKYTKANIIANN